MIKNFKWALLFLGLFNFLSTSASADWKEVKKSGQLRIAVDTTYPPMEFESNDGKIIGLDVDLAQDLASRLGLKGSFMVMPWDGILAGLTSNRYDLIMSSMTITDERAKVVNFIEYLQMAQVFVVKKGKKAVKNENDLKGLVVAVQADTTSAEALEAMKKKGIAIKDIKQFKGATETFGALKISQADVVITDDVVGHYYAARDAKNFEVSGQALAAAPIGLAIRKGDPELYRQVYKAMESMKKDGSYTKIYQKWLKTNPAPELLKPAKAVIKI